MTIAASEPPAASAAIDRYEADVGVKLPPDYRAFLLRSNGGRIRPNIFDISNTQDDVLNRFYGMRPGEQYDLRGAFMVMRDDLPAELIPIGETPGGNILCIAVRGAKTGTVFYHCHDDDVDADPAFQDFTNLICVARSFDDFLESLHD